MNKYKATTNSTRQRYYFVGALCTVAIFSTYHYMDISGVNENGGRIEHTSTQPHSTLTTGTQEPYLLHHKDGQVLKVEYQMVLFFMYFFDFVFFV
jgi:hypothetical protein